MARRPLKRTLSALIAAAWAAVALYAAIPASDAFTRANGALGSNWTDASTLDLRIVSNLVSNSGTNDSFECSVWASATDSFNANQSSEVQINFLDSDDSASVLVRASGVLGSGFSGYLLAASTGSDSTIDKIVSDAGSQVLSLSGTSFTNGDTLKLTVSGTTLTAYKNGVSIGSQTDVSIASGQPGICIYDANNADSATAIDNWVGDNIAGVSTTQRLLLLGISNEDP